MVSFPSTGILDNFNRANEGPPPSSNWTDSAGGLRVISGQCGGDIAGINAAYWNAQRFGNDIEGYFDVSVKPGVGEVAGIFIVTDDIVDGYVLTLTVAAGVDAVSLSRYDLGVPTLLATSAIEIEAGEKLGIRRQGGDIFVYHYRANKWNLLIQYEDNTYLDIVYVGIVIVGTTGRVDNFGGGKIPAISVGMPTFHRSRELSIIVSDPLYYSSRSYSERLTNQIDDFSHELRAIGGYWAATITINDSQRKIEDWIEYGLGRHIEVYNPALDKIGEYFVDSMSAALGPFQYEIGPLLDIGNRISVTYSEVDSVTEPPTVGIRVTTAVANNAISQARYGIIHKIYSINEAIATDATQLRDMLVDDPTRAFPATSRSSNLSGQSGPSVTLNCLGYWHWLKTYYYENSATGDVDLSTKIQDVLGDDPNGIFSTDYEQITTNTTQVPDYGSGERDGEAILKDLNSRGDAGNNPYTIGFYNNRVLVYRAVPTAVEYQQRITGNRGIADIGDEKIEPWDVTPAEYLFYPDFLVGRHPPITTESLGTDPRVGFIETVSFRSPYDLSVNGIKLSNVDQVLARRGMGGMA